MAISLSKTVVEYLATQDGFVSLEQLYKVAIEAGLDVRLEQVYAGVQSLASTGKIARGMQARTYGKLTSAPRSPTVLQDALNLPGTRISKGRVPKLLTGPISDESILAALTERLGPPIAKPNTYSYCLLLDGTWDIEKIFMRAEKPVNGQPKEWWTTNINGVTTIGFPLL